MSDFIYIDPYFCDDLLDPLLRINQLINCGMYFAVRFYLFYYYFFFFFGHVELIHGALHSIGFEFDWDWFNKVMRRY